MKKILLIAGMVSLLWACNNEGTATGSETDSSNNAANAPATYSPSEGDVTYRNGELMVWRSGSWVKAEGDVQLENGVVVHQNGHVERGDDVVILEDGEVVSHSGHFFDEAGHAINDAWDATKKGVKKAGEAVKKGADEVGEQVKDVFDGDDKKND